MGALVQDCESMRIKSPPGRAEAEGFWVGVHNQEPTPALRATPPGRGFSDVQRFTCKIQEKAKQRNTAGKEENKEAPIGPGLAPAAFRSSALLAEAKVISWI